jgi:hypothetical protein
VFVSPHFLGFADERGTFLNTLAHALAVQRCSLIGIAAHPAARDRTRRGTGQILRETPRCFSGEDLDLSGNFGFESQEVLSIDVLELQ